SFLRTLSGAIGTAVATTAWDTETRVSRSELVSHMNDTGGVMDRMQQAGLTLEQARAAVERLVDVQAATLGVLHIFLAAGVVFVIAAIAVWCAPLPKRVSMGASH
ncbi:MAG: MFS transporter, partial [Sphingopyxis macrogoltabida]